MVKIVVYDAIMGNGKTERIKKYMVGESRPILYITPLLVEVVSVVGLIHDDEFNPVRDDLGNYMYDESNPVSVKSFLVPNNRNANGNKLSSIKSLIAGKKNISSTHALFSMLDMEAISLLKSNGYVLVVDESLSVWRNFNLYDTFTSEELGLIEGKVEKADNLDKSTPSDVEVLNLIKQEIINVDPLGMLHWDTNKYDVVEGQFQYRIKKFCDMKQLYLSNGKVVFWEMNTVLFDAFEQVLIGTYMFEHSFMAYYLDANNMPYSVERFGNKPSFYKEFFNIYQGRMNNVGEKNYSLSYSDSCVKRHTKETHPKEILRKNLENFFKTHCDSTVDTRLWTCFVANTKHISGYRGRYSGQWVAYNIKATNKYRHKKDVAYLCNNFPSTFLIAMLSKRNTRKFNADMWALSECLQMLFRSRIRGDASDEHADRNINLYIPSKRMRNLLESWLNDEFEVIDE